LVGVLVVALALFRFSWWIAEKCAGAWQVWSGKDGTFMVPEEIVGEDGVTRTVSRPYELVSESTCWETGKVTLFLIGESGSCVEAWFLPFPPAWRSLWTWDSVLHWGSE
jgi:hypothetical protein